MKDEKTPKTDSPTESDESREQVATHTEPSEAAAEETETADTSELQQQLEVKTQEAQTAQDKYLRLAAEFENYKRRAQRDQSDSIKFANEKLLKDLVPTLDNFERALESGKEQSSTEALLEGIQLTHKQFLETLTKCGLQAVSSVGEPFDPAKHQAVAQVESDTASANTVIEEFQKGYFLQERIIRPAMVSVAKPPAGQQPTERESSSSEEGEDA